MGSWESIFGLGVLIFLGMIFGVLVEIDRALREANVLLEGLQKPLPTGPIPIVD